MKYPHGYNFSILLHERERVGHPCHCRAAQQVQLPHELLMLIGKKNTIATDASDGNTTNNTWKEFTYLNLLQHNLVTPHSFDYIFFSGNWSFSMASLWREDWNIFQYLIKNHPLLKDILVFQIWCLASVEQMGLSMSYFWFGACVSEIDPKIFLS